MKYRGMEVRVQHDEMNAEWLEYRDDKQKQRLAELDAREARKLASIAEIRAEKRKIMMTCQRRRRRKMGLE